MNVLSNATANLSASEKKLIAAALVLFAVLGSWQFIVKPVLTSKTNTQSQYDRAVRDYDIVQRALPRIAPNSEAASGGAPFDRTALINTARSVDLTISRVQPSANNGLQVWFEDTSSAKIYSFLQALDSAYAAELLSAQINRREGGTVSAQLSFVPRSGAGQ